MTDEKMKNLLNVVLEPKMRVVGWADEEPLGGFPDPGWSEVQCGAELVRITKSFARRINSAPMGTILRGVALNPRRVITVKIGTRLL